MYDRGLISKDTVTIETLGAGVQQLQLTVEGGKAAKVRVDMGEPILNGLARSDDD